MRLPSPFLVACLLGLAACQPKPEGPRAAYDTFALAVRRGDTKVAYAALSQPSRAAVEARSKEVAAASKGMIKDEPALMLFESGTRPAPLGEVKVVEESTTQAVLDVGGSRVKMIKEADGRWMVDLTDLYAGKQAEP